jgi:hypothetical protein
MERTPKAHPAATMSRREWDKLAQKLYIDREKLDRRWLKVGESNAKWLDL